MAFEFNEEEIRKAIAVFHPDGREFEIRLVDGQWNSAGVFNSADTLIEALREARIRPGANVYMTLNRLNDACYDRKHRDHFIEKQSPTVGDNDITGYDWLLVDVDPKRPAGTSSTNDQLKGSRETARKIYQWLKDKGWNEPIVAHSGNGTHLLYAISLTNNAERKTLVQNVLQVLGRWFSNDDMDIDQTTFNPSRICKLYGTVARKGSSTEKRPHRMARILQVPDKIEPVPSAFLEDLVKEIKTKEAPQQYNNYNPAGFDLQTWIDKHGLPVKSVVSWAGGRKWILDHCPFNPEHKHKDAAIIQTSDGKICFHCFHASCADKQWRDLRLLYEPDAYSKQYTPAVPNYMLNKPDDFGKPDDQDDEAPQGPVFRTTEEIRNRVVPQEAHILTGITGIDKRMVGLKKGFVTVLSGLRSAGKSSILSQLVLRCREQGFKCALFSGEMIDKQVLKWLTLQASGKAHTEGSQWESVFFTKQDGSPEAISKWLNEFVYIYNNDYGNRYTDLERYLAQIVTEKKLDLVLLDNLMALNVEDLDRDMYARQTKFVKRLKRMAEKLNIHILFVAHPRKSQGYLRMDDISGSGDLANAADNVFIIHRVDEDYKKLTQQYFSWKDSNPLYEADNVIEICKDRDWGNRDVYVPLYFEKETKRLRNTPTEYIHYGWEAEWTPPQPAESKLIPVIDPDLPF